MQSRAKKGKDPVVQALEVIRAEKSVRQQAFQEELDKLCMKYKVTITEAKLSVHDIDAEVSKGA